MPFIKPLSIPIKPLTSARRNQQNRNGKRTSGRAGGWVGNKRNIQDQDRNPQPDRGKGELPDIPNEVDTGRLEPVGELFGGTLLVSPNEAVHPFDCGLWPSSPFCNPEDAVNIGSFLDLSVDVYDNGHETVMVVQPVIAWLSFPPTIVAYRYGDPPQKTPKTEPNFPPQTTFYPVPQGTETQAGCIYIVEYEIIQSGYSSWTYWAHFGPIEGVAIIQYEPTRRVYPLIGSGFDLSLPWYASDYGEAVISHGDADYPDPRLWKGPLYSPKPHYRRYSLYYSNSPDAPTVGEIRVYLADLNVLSPEQQLRNYSDQIAWNLEHCGQLYGPLLPPPNSPYSPLPPEMCNCKQIEADLRAIKKFLGVTKEPWIFPISLGSEERETQSIPDIANMMVYFAKQMSGMLGATGEIKIKVKDSSITQEGDQEVELSFPNIAEAIANLTGLAITNQAISSATLDASLRGLFQAGQAFTSAAVGTEQIESIMEWMGFGMKKKSLQVPLAYTPGKESPDKILKDSQVYLSYWDVDDKKSLQDYLNIFIVASEIVKAANFQKLEDPFDYRVRVNHAAANLGERDVDLDSYLDRVEDGFINNASGSTDTTPYGRPYNERPRIRNINKEAGDGNNP